MVSSGDVIWTTFGSYTFVLCFSQYVFCSSCPFVWNTLISYLHLAWAHAAVYPEKTRRKSRPLLSSPFHFALCPFPLFLYSCCPLPLRLLSFWWGSSPCQSRDWEEAVSIPLAAWNMYNEYRAIEFILTHKYMSLAVDRGYVFWAWGRRYGGGGWCYTRRGREKLNWQTPLSHAATEKENKMHWRQQVKHILGYFILST